jgi:4'-phosphopantetheinyl transferase
VSGPLVVLVPASDLAPHEDWLGPIERAALRRFRAPKRRRDLRLGRFAAKRALAVLFAGEGGCDLLRFEIRPAPGGAPLAFHDGVPLDVGLSISHSDGWAVAAVSRGAEPLGCDIERVAGRSRAFLGDYFSRVEQAFVEGGGADDVARRATLLWSAKEAVMKALGQGLRLPPAAVRAMPDPGEPPGSGWGTFSIQAPPTATKLNGFWRPLGDFVLTVACGPDRPLLLRLSAKDMCRAGARSDAMEAVP